MTDSTAVQPSEQAPDDRTILRVRHDQENPYVMIARALLQNRALSYEARGMLAYLLSKPDDWQVQVPDLIMKGCGRDRTLRILNELKSAGHLWRTTDRQPREHGKFMASEWLVTEAPYTENPFTEKPYTEKPLTVNPHLHKKESLQKKEKAQKTRSRPRAKRPPVDIGYKVDWSLIERVGGSIQRWDGSLVTVSERPALASRAVLLFEGYLLVMRQLGRLPTQGSEALWTKHQEAALLLALEGDAITPEAIQRYVLAYYKGDDPFWRDLGFPMRLSYIQEHLSGWLAAGEPAPQGKGRALATAPVQSKRNQIDDYYVSTYGKYDASPHRGVSPDDPDMQTTPEERAEFERELAEKAQRILGSRSSQPEDKP